jgi:hypothetical protein
LPDLISSTRDMKRGFGCCSPRWGVILPFQPGVGLLASRLNVPVVPVRLKGVGRVLSCISEQLIECEANRRVVGGNNGTRARSGDNVDRHVMRDDLLQDAEVSGAAQTSAAEREADSNRSLLGLAWCSTATQCRAAARDRGNLCAYRAARLQLSSGPPVTWTSQRAVAKWARGSCPMAGRSPRTVRDGL